jgi:PadR family transcriptional regulator
LTSLPNTSSVSHRQTMGRTEAVELLPGTLDLLIPKAPVPGAMRTAMASPQHLKSVSDDVLQVGGSSLYPALQRLLLEGWVKAE